MAAQAKFQYEVDEGGDQSVIGMREGAHRNDDRTSARMTRWMGQMEPAASSAMEQTHAKVAAAGGRRCIGTGGSGVMRRVCWQYGLEITPAS